MKICITGAGSTRLPLMMASIASSPFKVDQVTLFDVNPERIKALMPVGLSLCRYLGRQVHFQIARTFEDAVEGCDALILTIRPGLEERRASDERACLNLGIIGQETTGPAGFAFATRTIPAVTNYCRLAQRLTPDFLPVIFTNPAGMVTQALHDQGFSRAVGICDSATAVIKKIAAQAGVNAEKIDFRISGLNHLSWTRQITGPDGSDLLDMALKDNIFLKRLIPWLTKDDGDSELPESLPVEYLYYFLRPHDALGAMLREPFTRGEGLIKSNQALFSALGKIKKTDPVVRYAAYLHTRNDTYMSYALGPRHGNDAPVSVQQALSYLHSEIGGYAEVAMELLSSAVGGTGERRLMALNVRNGDSIPELKKDDVVEIDCTVKAGCITPRHQPPMPEKHAALVRQVKEYERLAVRSILCRINKGDETTRNRLALDALTAHPLVPDRRMAEKLAAALQITG